MTHLQKVILARVVLFAALTLGGCAFLVSVDVTGEWAGTLLWIDGPSSGFTSSISLTLTHENRNVSGTVTLMGPGSQPFDLAISSGRTSARSVRIEASGVADVLTPPRNVSISLDGDFDEDQMSGAGLQTIDGNTYQFTWELVRISAPSEP